MVNTPFSINDDRLKIADFPYLVTGDAFLSILSYPQIYAGSDIFKMINIFTKESWLLIIFVFILVTSINNIQS